MPHNPQILTSIRNSIDASDKRCIPFSAFMHLALYGSDDAYYRREDRKLGRQGDFFTSVSVGRMFGLALAEWIAARWNELGKPSPFTLVEQGAHDATLLLDILQHLSASHPQCRQATRAIIVEPFATARNRQQTNIRSTPHLDDVSWVGDWSEIPPASLTGIVYCNELLDAFPTERIRRGQQSWERMMVTHANDDHGQPVFQWLHEPIEDGSPLARQIARTQGLNFNHLPCEYLTELNPGIEPWLKAASSVLQNGLLLAIDYGFGAEDYYHATRTGGTLRTYLRHQAIDDPLLHVGESDITAHVDFTWVETIARSLGLRAHPLVDQGKFLIEAARDWMLALEKSGLAAEPDAASLLRQFNTLTHPGNMGRKFKVQVMEVEA